MLMPKTSKEGVENIQRGGFRFRQKDPDKTSGLINNQEVRRESIVRGNNTVGVLVETRKIRCGGVHETKIHVEAPLSLNGTFGRPLSSLFLYASLLFPIDKTKRVILETRRNASDVAR
jgi:hypothetical protein